MAPTSWDREVEQAFEIRLDVSLGPAFETASPYPPPEDPKAANGVEEEGSGAPLRRTPSPFPLLDDGAGGITGAEYRCGRGGPLRRIPTPYPVGEGGSGAPLRRTPTPFPFPVRGEGEGEGVRRVQEWLRGCPSLSSASVSSGDDESEEGESTAATEVDSTFVGVVGKLGLYGVGKGEEEEEERERVKKRRSAVKGLGRKVREGVKVVGEGVMIVVRELGEGWREVGSHVRAGWRQWREREREREREERALYDRLLGEGLIVGRKVRL